VTLRFAAPSFNEIVVRVPLPAATVLAALQARGVIAGLDLGRFYPELADCILMNATELITTAQIAQLAAGLEEIVRDAVARV
jgi:glycine dehydrogenase subunit 1